MGDFRTCFHFVDTRYTKEKFSSPPRRLVKKDDFYPLFWFFRVCFVCFALKKESLLRVLLRVQLRSEVPRKFYQIHLAVFIIPCRFELVKRNAIWPKHTIDKNGVGEIDMAHVVGRFSMIEIEPLVRLGLIKLGSHETLSFHVGRKISAYIEPHILEKTKLVIPCTGQLLGGNTGMKAANFEGKACHVRILGSAETYAAKMKPGQIHTGKIAVEMEFIGYLFLVVAGLDKIFSVNTRPHSALKKSIGQIEVFTIEMKMTSVFKYGSGKISILPGQE